MNCDGWVNEGDVDPFVLAMLDPAAYAAAYPACDINLGDMDGSGTLDGRDVQGFVSALLQP